MDQHANEWTPLAEPYQAANGLTVITAGSMAQLEAIGIHFHNALSGPTGRRVFGTRRDRSHVYQVNLGDVPLSCGQLEVSEGRLVVRNDRAQHNMPGTAETIQAVEDFARAVNEGEVEVAYAMEGNGFAEKTPNPAP